MAPVEASPAPSSSTTIRVSNGTNEIYLNFERSQTQSDIFLKKKGKKTSVCVTGKIVWHGSQPSERKSRIACRGNRSPTLRLSVRKLFCDDTKPLKIVWLAVIFAPILPSIHCCWYRLILSFDVSYQDREWERKREPVRGILSVFARLKESMAIKMTKPLTDNVASNLWWFKSFREKASSS